MSMAASAADVSRADRTWTLPWVPWVLLWCVLTPVAASTFADPDLWGNIRLGLDVLAQRSLRPVDLHSFTGDVPWVNHEWLSETILAAAYQLGGVRAIVAVKTTLVLATYAVVASALAGSWPAASTALLLLFAIATLPVTLTLRPQLWTFLGTAILCRVLPTPPTRRWLIGLPVLFCVWANMHGGWIVGAGILAVWTAAQIVRPAAPLLLIGAVDALSALATLVNPYGIRMWGFLGRTVAPARNITEWQPITMATPAIWVPYLLVLVVVGMLLLTRHRPRFDALAIMAALAFGAFRVMRLGSLWAAAAVVLVGPTLRMWSAAVPRKWWTFRVTSAAAARLMLVPATCAVIAAGVRTAQATTCIPINGVWVPDFRAAKALADAHASGRLVTAFEWGEFAIWHFGPALQVSMDGRRETLYSEAVLAKHDALYAGTAEGLQYLNQLSPSYVWLPSSRSQVRDWLAAHGYRLDVQTPRSFVAVRRDLPALSAPASAGPQVPCFPGL